MLIRKFLHRIRPLLSALAVITLSALLVMAIYYTDFGMQWIAFLAGILIAAMVARMLVAHAEWIAMRRTAQFTTIKEKLEHEIHLRKGVEKNLHALKPRLQLLDEHLPTMVALIDIEGRCIYHNRALMNWLQLKADKLQGQHLRDIFGATVYQETAAAVRLALTGQAVHYQRTHNTEDGAHYRLSVDHLPQFGEDGNISGFYMLINNITASAPDLPAASTERVSLPIVGSNMKIPLQDGKSNQDMFVASFSEQVSGQKDAHRITSAIEKGDFHLYCQIIAPLGTAATVSGHYEILVRLAAEEEGMMPPGAFFPLAEKYGLMPQLDRWVVQHVSQWIALQNSHGAAQHHTCFFINVSAATILDPGFTEFLRLTLLEHGIPGAALCFEITGSELAARSVDVAEFARRIRQCGCRIALSGFGREQVLFDLIRGFEVDYLKIDGSIILNILRDPLYLARVTAIDRVAKKIGVQTIAELVESEETIQKLRDIGIDFAQGFGISKPRPLTKT